MKTQFHLRNKKGFTISELMIAVALTTIVGLGVFQVLTDTSKMQRVFSDKMDTRIEANLADKLIIKDLRAAGVSMNNINFKDDNNLGFFDFDSDRSTAFYRGQSIKNRTYTLKAGGKTTFYFMAVDDLRGRGLFADAVTFFQVGAPPANPNLPATLTYMGINYNNYLTAKDSDGNFLNNPLLINPVNLLKLALVDSSSYMPVIPLKPAVFIGKIAAAGSRYDIVKLANAEIPKNNQGEPILGYTIRTPAGTNLEPGNFEQYMYNLPPVGANGASVRIKPVRIYKYSLECKTKQDCILYRTDVLHGASTQKFPVLRGFNKIVFLRDDIATSVFNVTMEKLRDEQL